VLFGTVLWSKFAHMFFKPAAAFQKRVTKADGSMENLPEIPDLSDPVTHEKYPDIPEYLGKNHRSDPAARLQHRTQHVLGVLLLCQSLPHGRH
jgi:hypothetical protein